MRSWCAGVVATALIATTAAAQSVPAKIGYQGRVIRTDGTPETGTPAITFRIFAAATGGTSLWSETQAVALTQGFYSTFLGDTTPLPASVFDGAVLYLEVQIGTTVLAPRQRLASVAYAFRANQAADAEKLAGLASTAFLQTADRTPAGAVQMFAGAAAPAGYALCNGQAVSRTTNAALFAAIGTAYGIGDGTTTFNVPDLRGRIPVGIGTAAQVSTLGGSDGLAVGGRKIAHRHGKGTIAASGGSHSHSVHYQNLNSSTAAQNWPNMAAWDAVGRQFDAFQSSEASSHSHPNGEFSGEVGDTTGPSEGPAFLVVNYIIKL